MQLLNYFLVSFLSWLGIISGIILLKIAPEEKKPLAKVFSSVSGAAFVMIFLFSIYFFYDRVEYIAGLLSAALLLFFFRKLGSARRLMTTYFALGLIFFISMQNMNLFIINSSLIFVYGTGKASELYSPRKKEYGFVYCSLIFILVSNLMFLII